MNGCGYTESSTVDGYEWRCMTEPHPLRPDEHYLVRCLPSATEAS